MTKIETLEKIKCYHCGDDCRESDISIDNKYFCCSGCRFVYELFRGNKLDGYYRLNANPGVNRRVGARSDRFACLEDRDIARKLVDFADDKINRVTFHIPGIHCSSCVWLLENLNRLHPGIPLSRVNYMRKEVSLTFIPEQISLREVVELLSSVGYDPEINLRNLERKTVGMPKDRLYTRLTVAGFCFANIMLFSFPEYFDAAQIAPKFRNFFGFLKVALALPVFFYSSAVFFKSAYHGLRQRIVNMDVPISLGILMLFARSFYELFSATGIGYMDSFTGLVFFLLIGRVFQKKTYQRLSFDRDYKSYFPISVNRKEGNTEIPVAVNRLGIGDRIIIRNKELVPADSVLLEGNGQFDYSFVTGESQPLEKKPGDIIYAGGRIAGKAVELEVIKKVSESYLVELWGDNIFNRTERTGIESLSNTISKYFTVAVITLSIATAVYWYFVDPSVAANAATAVLIIACPCALALSTPFTLGTATRILGRNGFFLRNSRIVESLAGINSIVFDKTGTLTRTGESKIKFIGVDLSARQRAIVKSITGQSSHPLSRKISRLFSDDPVANIESFEEFPGLGLSGVIDDSTVKIGSAEWIGLTNSEQQSSDNFKTRVYCSVNDNILGYFSFTNVYRDGLESLINSLRSKFRLYLLSGDNDGERENMKRLFGDDSRMLFNQSPHDKLEFVKQLQSGGDRVAMLGDGLNDAGSLKQSDIGIAVTVDTSSFSPASDAILDSNSLHVFDKLVLLSIKCLRVIKISFGISFLYNIIGLSFAVSGTISPLLCAVLMPLSSVSVVLFTTLTIAFLARRLELY
ncbi:MAG: heavy metal translocating P-type ATPase metal-binding domain-containing protein [candidate division Zixibacteria bacterium]